MIISQHSDTVLTSDQDNGQGPWGGRNQSPWGQKPTDETPEAILRQAQDRFKNTFGGGGNGRNRMPGSPADMKRAIGFAIVVAIGFWLSTGFYRVQSSEDAVLLTFGKWTDTKTEAGLGYHLPWPVQAIQKVDVGLDRRMTIGFRDDAASRSGGDNSAVPFESQMLTGDENIININFVVLWNVGDAGKYLFKIRDPETTIKKVAESAMREIVGRTPIQKALTEARGEIETKTKELMQKVLDEYQSGVVVNSVQLLQVDPPAPVVDAFDDVQRARADRERLKNEAETYTNDILPKARGEAQKTVKDAEGYKESIISKATGDADRFVSVYNAYAKNKDVTTKRLYLETIESIMKNSKKIIVDSDKGAPVLPYLLNQPPAQPAGK